MKEKFEVIDIGSQMMKLKVNRSSGCHSCSVSSGCGTGILSKYFDNYSAFNKPLQNGVVVGDMIVLEISPKELFYRGFQLYILPILLLFVGGLLGGAIYPEHELWQIILAFICFFAYLLLIKYFVK